QARRIAGFGEASQALVPYGADHGQTVSYNPTTCQSTPDTSPADATSPSRRGDAFGTKALYDRCSSSRTPLRTTYGQPETDPLDLPGLLRGRRPLEGPLGPPGAP